ncbi:MAG: CorA family divalent cation transporter [Clostridia bacterium]
MLDESGLLLYHYEENSIDNIDVFEDHVVGTFVVPMKGSVLESKVSVGFYVTESRILLLDETSMLYNVLERMTKRQKIRDLDISHVFVRILDCMISDDMLLLQKYSMVLDQMEDYLEENVSDLPHNFTSFIMQNKKELRALMVYYRSLNYMVDELAESDIFDGIVERRLQSFDNKATKLYAETASLHEAAQQLRDVYQAKIDIRQNKVMSILTIVTTIFMPLTLIVGWYGMNVKMPEVGWPYSYPIIILASIAVTIIEILIFKKKKWF